MLSHPEYRRTKSFIMLKLEERHSVYVNVVVKKRVDSALAIAGIIIILKGSESSYRVKLTFIFVIFWKDIETLS